MIRAPPKRQRSPPIPAITIPGGATAPELDAHLAVPPLGDRPWPGVVVLHESFGLIDDIRRQADRLAAAGYLAVAPDLYSAGGAVRCIRATFRAVMSGEGAAFDDIEAVRAWLRERPDCTGRVGVPHDVKEYPGAGHSFLNAHPFGPGGALLRVAGVGYDGPSAEDAWRRILRFFDAQLGDQAETR